MILVSGSLAYDRIMNFHGHFSDHIDPKKLHVLSVSFMAHQLKENFGGTAGNIAYNLALLGESPRIISAAGTDFAPYKKWLGKHGVDLSWVQTIKNDPCASAYIMTDEADCQITAFYPGAMRKKFPISNFQFPIILKKIKLAIVAPGNIEDMRALPKLYRKHKVPFIFDPGQAIPALSGDDLRNGINGAKIFISNDYELAMVLKKTEWNKNELLKRVEVLVTTLGEHGSVIEVNTKWHNAPQPPLNSRGGDANDPPLKIRPMARSARLIEGGAGGVMSFQIPSAKPKNTSDPTGAGDAYRAGLIKGLLMGLPYDKIGRLAAVVSVYTVEKYGTQTHHFTWPQILKRYKENFKENLV